MTNLEMYIALSYLIMFIPCFSMEGLRGLVLWFLSPITFPMVLGNYLDEKI